MPSEVFQFPDFLSRRSTNCIITVKFTCIHSQRILRRHEVWRTDEIVKHRISMLVLAILFSVGIIWFMNLLAEKISKMKMKVFGRIITMRNYFVWNSLETQRSAVCIIRGIFSNFRFVYGKLIWKQTITLKVLISLSRFGCLFTRYLIDLSHFHFPVLHQLSINYQVLATFLWFK